jgi:uncharacterized membrane protein YedE/YeeE
MKSNIIVYIGGLIFGLGLSISKMTRPEVVLDFLHLNDFGLMLVMGFAILIFSIVIKFATTYLNKSPTTKIKYAKRERRISKDIVFGGIIFGVGWGVSGVCPGAAYASLGTGNFPIVFAIIGMLVGTYLFSFEKRKKGIQ